MAQMAIPFNIWRRKHYDKSTLSFVSDSDYQKNFLLTTGNANSTGCHSMLRAHTQSHDNASNFEKVAKTIASTGFLINFCGAFVPGYMRGQSNFNFWQIAGKSAEFIWGPVLVKIILINFTETELIKLFVQLILWCLLNIYFYFPNYIYIFYILFFTSFKS